jgi:hypothetical protein
MPYKGNDVKVTEDDFERDSLTDSDDSIKDTFVDIVKQPTIVMKKEDDLGLSDLPKEVKQQI